VARNWSAFKLAADKGAVHMSLAAGGVVFETADSPDWSNAMLRWATVSADRPTNPCMSCRVEHRVGLVSLTLLQRLADAQDHVEVGGQGHSSLLVDEQIGIASLCWRSLRLRITCLQPRSRRIIGWPRC
jgi:hypothetical protein